MMLFTCDLTSAFEDGGVGGVIVAIAWGLVTWWRAKGHEVKKA